MTRTIALAFHDDPAWSWVFADPARRQEQYSVFMGLFVTGALRYPWVLTTEAYEAVAVWIPPGGVEMTEEDEARVEPLLEELVGERAGEVIELLDRFEAAHPREQPHYYLSLLATDPAQAGRGLGMGLLAENLARVDQERLPAYLESTNPANNHRYERHGFEQVGEFYPPGGTTPITTMWRDAR